MPARARGRTAKLKGREKFPRAAVSYWRNEWKWDEEYSSMPPADPNAQETEAEAWGRREIFAHDLKYKRWARELEEEKQRRVLQQTNFAPHVWVPELGMYRAAVVVGAMRPAVSSLKHQEAQVDEPKDFIESEEVHVGVEEVQSCA